MPPVESLCPATFVDGDVATSLISGTAITLLLEHGPARGSAGCNEYGGKYALRPGILEIPEIDITEQRCLEPAGIMEQETQYIALLESVTTFELDGNQLVLGTDGGSGLVFVAQAPLTSTQASPEPPAAQEALIRYFSLLSDGQYSQAVELYGGDYDTLTVWNPEIDPSDHAGLLERGCMMNGLQCLVVHQIGAIAQAWAVLSGGAQPARALQAMEAVAARLVDSESQLMTLFAPPFDKTLDDPAYISGYPPGVRENGGQYTHGALWGIWAFAKLGQGDRAARLFRLLNPIHHTASPEQVARYMVEPYAIAADVYSVAPHKGRGGWTWYTGSASWMYRVGLEAILGLQRSGSSFQISPCIPRDWPGYKINYRDGGTLYRISVRNPQGVNQGVKNVTLDGDVLPGLEIPLLGDGQAHEVEVEMG